MSAPAPTLARHTHAGGGTLPDTPHEHKGSSARPTPEEALTPWNRSSLLTVAALNCHCNISHVNKHSNINMVSPMPANMGPAGHVKAAANDTLTTAADTAARNATQGGAAPGAITGPDQATAAGIKRPEPSNDNGPLDDGGGGKFPGAATNAGAYRGAAATGASASARMASDDAAAGAATAALLTASTARMGEIFSHLSPDQRAQLAVALGASTNPIPQASPYGHIPGRAPAIVQPTPNLGHVETGTPHSQSYAKAAAGEGGKGATADSSDSEEDDLELLLPTPKAGLGG